MARFDSMIGDPAPTDALDADHILVGERQEIEGVCAYVLEK